MHDPGGGMTPTPTRPGVARTLSAAWRRIVIGRVPKLFDARFYERTYPDVAASGLDPFLHYVRRGAALNYNPSADFDTAYYCAQSGRTRLDPLRDYVTNGVKAGFDPSPAFSTLTYLTRYPDVAMAGANPLLHFRTDGRAERRVATPSIARPAKWVFLDGVPEARQWRYPSARVPRFCLSLRRDIPLKACMQAAPRICLILSLDGDEIAAVVHHVGAFADAAQDVVTIDIDMKARLHPPSPTLAIALESCFHGSREADGTILVRYAEARIWDLAATPPQFKASFPPGCLAVRNF